MISQEINFISIRNFYNLKLKKPLDSDKETTYEYRLNSSKIICKVKSIGTDVFFFQTFPLSLVEIQSQIFLAYLVWTFDLGMYCKEGKCNVELYSAGFP